MKHLKTYMISGLAGICTLGMLNAQETPMQAETTNEKQIASETTQKTYKVLMGDEVIKNTVRVSTEVSQEMKWKKEDEKKRDKDRVFPKKKIIKTVEIDSDKDDDFDERIRFSYRADNPTDFTLITNGKEIMVAVENGDDLSILESEQIYIDDLHGPSEAYVFTNNEGKEVEFFIEDYKSYDPNPDM